MGANPTPRSTYPWESTMGCTSGYPSETVTLVATWIKNGLPGQTTTTIFGAGGQGVNAFSVEVRFQSTDFQSSATVCTRLSTLLYVSYRAKNFPDTVFCILSNSQLSDIYHFIKHLHHPHGDVFPC